MILLKHDLEKHICNSITFTDWFRYTKEFHESKYETCVVG